MDAPSRCPSCSSTDHLVNVQEVEEDASAPRPATRAPGRSVAESRV